MCFLEFDYTFHHHRIIGRPSTTFDHDPFFSFSQSNLFGFDGPRSYFDYVLISFSVVVSNVFFDSIGLNYRYYDASKKRRLKKNVSKINDVF